MALLISTAALPDVARAEEPAKKPWLETWVGVDATSKVWLAYSGITVAPFGDIWSNGWLVRADGGYGRYGGSIPKNLVPSGMKSLAGPEYDVSTAFAQLMVGYQFKAGNLTSKVLAGVTLEQATASNAHYALWQWSLGPTLAIEEWMDINDRWWAAADASWSYNRNAVSARLRAGYRVTGRLSVGAEARVDMSRDWMREAVDKELKSLGISTPSQSTYFITPRAGLFASYLVSGFDVSVSGGATLQESELGKKRLGIYTNLNIALPF